MHLIERQLELDPVWPWQSSRHLFGLPLLRCSHRLATLLSALAFLADSFATRGRKRVLPCTQIVAPAASFLVEHSLEVEFRAFEVFFNKLGHIAVDAAQGFPREAFTRVLHV